MRQNSDSRMPPTHALTLAEPVPLRILAAPWFMPACLTLAFVLRAMILMVPLEQSSDFLWYFQRAAGLAHGEGFADRGVLTAFWPVGWPGALAALFTVTGVSTFAGQLANLAMGVLVCWITAILGERLTGRRAVGRLAALLIAIYPNQVAYVPLLSTEIFYELLLLLGVLLLVRERAATGLVAGLVFGVATLTKAQSLVLPGFLLLWVWLARPSWPALRRLAGVGCAAYVALILVVAPWTYRNWSVFHSFIPVSTNGGWTLLTGNNPQARGDYTPDTVLAEGINRDPADQVAMDRVARQRGIAWIKANPGRFLELLPAKAVRLWVPDGEAEWFYARGLAGYQHYSTLSRFVRIVNQAYYFLLVLAAFPAMVLLLRGRLGTTPWAHVGVALFVLTTLISLVFSGQSRFHFSLMPFVAIYAAWFMVGRSARRSLTSDLSSRPRNPIIEA